MAVIGDVHLGCTQYTEKRVADFSKQFVSAIEIAISKRVDCILLLGDIFDSSAYRRSVDSFATVLSEIGSVLQKIRTKGIQVFSIAGNHEYGRGREAGEIRVLNDLGFIRLLRDETVEYKGFKITGISWKSDVGVLKKTLQMLATKENKSILLIHQFCSGSTRIPPFRWEVGEKDLESWEIVFSGHHHQHETIGRIMIPGSLEIQSPEETTPKGFIIFDTDAMSPEFVRLDTARRVRYLAANGSGKTAEQLERELREWVGSNSALGVLLVVRLKGQLKEGRSSDINWRALRAVAIQNQALALAFEGGLEEAVRSASQIRTTVNFNDYLRTKFGARSKRAIEYVDKMREHGDEFGTELLDNILSEAGKK